MLSKPISLNLNYRPQLLVGFVMGVWLYIFLVFVGPFDSAELSLAIRTILMIGYGLVFFLCYALLIPIQNRLFASLGEWKLRHEIAILSLFSLYSLPFCFGYYKTELVNGDFGFSQFALTIYLPTILILLPVLFAGRYLITRRQKIEVVIAPPDDTITLNGDNKLDILKLSMSNLIALEASNNYVTVYYLIDGQFQKKLLRSSLRKMHETVPEMVKVHRSYLVNTQHFIEWKDAMTLGLTQFSVPVSQKYKASLMAMPVFVPS